MASFVNVPQNGSGNFVQQGMPMQNAIGQPSGPNFAPPQNQMWPVQQQQQVQPQGPRMIIDWVDGEAGMVAYPIGPDTIAYLFDKTNAGVFYIKMTDRSGMPVAPRTFLYNEKVNEKKVEEQPISRKEFDELFSMVSAIKEAL